MRSHVYHAFLPLGILTVLVTLAVVARDGAALAAPKTAREMEQALKGIAGIKGASPEEGNRQRSEALTHLFQQYLGNSNGDVSAQSVREFNALVKQAGMTSFDDFYDAMMAPVRYRTDSTNGKRVPVFGALGSDIINPWLAAMGVNKGKPLDEQPMYKLAADVLREHIDFALIGVRDPNLSFELMPSELRDTARRAYASLNPANKFAGGFDHPLFYITVREAARKLFREDHPAAKMTMADVVLPEEQGGLGIRSCLLCHNRDYTDVYARLLGQSQFYRKKAADQLAANDTNVPGSVAYTDEIKQAEEMAGMFQLAANRVLEVHSDRIDTKAAQKSLQAESGAITDRLLPGFDEFYATLDTIGCTMCHSSEERPEAEHDPAKFGAFVLTPNNYFKSKNVTALLELIDRDALSDSKLLAKASGKIKHRGADELQLNEAELQQLKDALYRWVHSLDR